MERQRGLEATILGKNKLSIGCLRAAQSAVGETLCNRPSGFAGPRTGQRCDPNSIPYPTADEHDDPVAVAICQREPLAQPELARFRTDECRAH